MNEAARLAQNEALFREVNERLQERTPLDPRSRISFVCECARTDCAARICLTRTEYEALRADPAQFAMLRDHVVPEIELVVRLADDYAVVRKRGTAATVAAELDPRA